MVHLYHSSGRKRFQMPKSFYKHYDFFIYFVTKKNQWLPDYDTQSFEWTGAYCAFFIDRALIQTFPYNDFKTPSKLLPLFIFGEKIKYRFFLIKKHVRQKINYINAKRGPEIYSNHYTVKAKILVQE